MAANAVLLMKLTGSSSGWIKGESEFKSHTDYIELTDWNWSIEQKDENPEPSVFSFSKLMDRASTAMLSAMHSGETLTVELVMEDTGGDYFHMEVLISKALIIDYSFDAQAEEAAGEITERWKLHYGTIKISHREDPAKGLVSFEVKRSSDASTSTSEETVGKIRELGAKMEARTAKELFERLVREIEEGKFPPPKVEPKANEEAG